ncbi:MAG TPA: NlpC/P60 family protein [Campylobacterales bacterium]|nr:NlpC/P60 family protein [Campylobacterales bacterium]
MNFSKNNLIKILPIISSICLFNGCVSKNVDGSYPITYSYHPYNKLYKSKKTYKPRKIYNASYKPKRVYRTHKVYNRRVNYQPKRVYQPRKTYVTRRPNHIQFQRNDFFKQLKPITRENRTISINQPNKVENIIKMALSQMGKTYVWGATGPFTFDCSGFTQFVYEQNGIELPRVSKNQAQVGKFIDKNHLKRGDLIFFSSSKSDDVHHVGIYLGNGQFVHASSAKKQVTVSNLNQKYYKEHFKWGRRYIQQGDRNRFVFN